MYTRWEYSDTPHYFTRILFHMNPDGTNQLEYYGSNSYWPNSIFYARPIPNHPTKVVAVISGHHGSARMGELVLFDPAKSQRESAGAVQRIPGYQKPVPPTIADGLVDPTLAEIPAPLSAQRQVLPRLDAADRQLAVGHLPGRRLRQPHPAARKSPAMPASSPCR